MLLDDGYRRSEGIVDSNACIASMLVPPPREQLDLLSGGRREADLSPPSPELPEEIFGRNAAPGRDLHLRSLERGVQLCAVALCHVRERIGLVEMRKGIARVPKVFQVAPGRLLLPRRKRVHELVKVLAGRVAHSSDSSDPRLRSPSPGRRVCRVTGLIERVTTWTVTHAESGSSPGGSGTCLPGASRRVDFDEVLT
jgi:hypothetical protein